MTADVKTRIAGMRKDEYRCPRCGSTFRAYRNRNRKYCSHECYIADRFGGGK